MPVISVPTTLQYHVTYSLQNYDDHEDGMMRGWYAWVARGANPDQQSDFVLGPYETRAIAEETVPRRLAGEEPETRLCISCCKVRIPRRWQGGEPRMHCDACLDK